MATRYDALLTTTKLARRDEAPGILVDEAGDALSRLAVNSSAQYLVRPDGHIAFRCAGVDLVGVREYLERWFDGAPRGV
ncbi:MAG: hypothetical protein GEU90_09325 [Gemmatimonas sp.]|nr:hypothetical protein [Gemmatimonas sp.]